MGGGLCFFANVIEGGSLPSGLVLMEATIGGFAFAVAANYRPAGMDPAVAKTHY